eukprot:1483447-Pleurochrysis_carterae.AAC.3
MTADAVHSSLIPSHNCGVHCKHASRLVSISDAIRRDGSQRCPTDAAASPACKLPTPTSTRATDRAFSSRKKRRAAHAQMCSMHMQPNVTCKRL